MLNFQEMIARLTQFWAKQGCVVHQGYDLEVGAGTFNPATFLRCLGPEPYSAVYVEPSRRPKDGRYGENPNRVQFYHQMQVIMKPSPSNFQDLYLQSLEEIGFNLNEHDIRFVHDDWENPTIGAWGLGWEIWIDGMEVTQFTYFQAVGGLPVNPVSGEITYGLERLAMYLQGVDSIFDIKWNETITYGDIFKRNEWEWSHYNFKEADATMWLRHFEDFEKEAKKLIRSNLPIPAYDFVMKASHAFNILDARGVISVTERTGYIGRIRTLAKELAEAYLKSREEQNFPLLSQQKATQKTYFPAPVSSTWSADEKEDFLLEIGSEELPATFVPIGLANLEREMHQFLKSHALPYETILTYGTPRRLAVLVKGLKGGTAPQKSEKKGPSLIAAYDKEGHLTKAGEGFFQSLNILPPSLDVCRKGEAQGISIRESKGTEYLFAHIETKGVSTREILAQHLSSLVLKIDFPKKMRWGSWEFEYARPLRWFVSLYGKEEISFAIGDIVSGRVTYGHRQLAPQPISLAHPHEYLEKLRNHSILADIEERKKSILSQLQDIEKQLKGKALAQEKVLPQVLHLVEKPFLTANIFDPLFLEAPKEVLISEMVEHQKYFPVADDQGNLLPSFIITANTTPSDKIRHGNQMALAPRLADGFFLYREDLKTPLEAFHKKLKAITFQKELGSMEAKVHRLIQNVEVLYQWISQVDLTKAKRAALLSKADLATELVGEFPELQGTIGHLYALHAGEDPLVSQAIEEQWMPRGEKAPLPISSCGILLSLADKIDNFLSCFALRLQPTSSSDPYALRRQALGMIKMIIQGKYFIPLHSLLDQCFERFCSNPELDQKTRQQFLQEKSPTIEGIISFLASRLKTVFLEMAFEKDEIEAVLSKGLQDIYASVCLITSLHTFRQEKHQAFSSILEVYTRSKKILLSQKSPAEYRYPAINPTLLTYPSEKALFEKMQEIEKQIHSHITAYDYTAAFSLITGLGPLLANLFDTAKILDENTAVRTNRLALLQKVWDLCELLADFSKIQEHSDVKGEGARV